MAFPDVVEIIRKSQTASYKIRSTGALRKLPDFDDLVVVPAQVSRPQLTNTENLVEQMLF